MSWQEGTFEVSSLRSPQKRMIVMNAALQTGIGKLCKLSNCPPPRFDDRASDSEFARKVVVDVHTGEQYHKFMLASPRDRLVRDRFQKLALDLLPAGAAVLDFGAGTGIDAKTYAANGHRTFVHEPSPVRPSQTFEIPVVTAALRVQELAIEHSQEIGSHVFFLCRVVSGENLAESDQLHHTAGFHQAYRRRRGTPFAEM